MTPFAKSTLAACALAGLAAAASAGTVEEGAKAYQEICAPCHSTDMRPLDGLHLSRSQWQEQIDRMSGFGADIPSGKVPALLDYLVATHGPAGNGQGGKQTK
ncbi:cytochrome c [Geomonas sp. Red32]|uniref:c-type cytochrome n=1 Tax=Geomonas sp. Red32 TaxID=2912856 RepID=UPI00202CE80E|nr:cytochrome c [Geomonas sp. Red32]MCM0080880.1 cytochrome c [Geomonas sp. Red32]